MVLFALALCFPLRYVLTILSDLAAKQNITDIGDDHIVAWANAKVGNTLYYSIIYHPHCSRLTT